MTGKPFFLTMTLLATLGMTGCAIPGLGSGDYERSEARGEQSVRVGVVESVRSVKLEGTRSGIGAATGAVLGGLGGSEIGQGRGAVAGAVAGAVVGGIAGQAVEQAGTKKAGVEVTIKLEGGRLVAITQEADPNESFRVGDRVRILSGGGASRVTHY